MHLQGFSYFPPATIVHYHHYQSKIYKLGSSCSWCWFCISKAKSKTCDHYIRQLIIISTDGKINQNHFLQELVHNSLEISGDWLGGWYTFALFISLFCSCSRSFGDDRRMQQCFAWHVVLPISATLLMVLLLLPITAISMIFLNLHSGL